MNYPIQFFVPGKAQPAGSKRGFAIKKGGVYTGRVSITDANKKSKPWKEQVAAEAKKVAPVVPFSCALRLRVFFFMERPKSVKPNERPFPTVKPDTTKLLRGLEDACTGILWRDDAQIVSQHVYKRYGTPGVHVEVSEECP